MTITAGIDIGTGAVKAVLFDVDGDRREWLGRQTARIRRRDPLVLARESYDALLEEAGLSPDDVGYVATTGEGENVEFRTGHFYSMTTHARGAIYLEPATRAVLDVGALHGRAISIDERGKVLSYKTANVPRARGSSWKTSPAILGSRSMRSASSRSRQAIRNRSAASAPCWRRRTSSTWFRAGSRPRTS